MTPTSTEIAPVSSNNEQTSQLQAEIGRLSNKLTASETKLSILEQEKLQILKVILTSLHTLLVMCLIITGT
jgi:hypothetical protein